MKILLFIITILLIALSDTYAQWPNTILCPTDTTACPWDTTIVNRRVQLSYKHDQYALVTYRVRVCNGVTEIEIISISTLDNAGQLRTFTIEHYEFSTLRSAIELGLMTDHERENGINGLTQGSPADCSDTVSYVNFYTASCGIFVACIYDYSSRYFCSRGINPYPDYDSASFKKVVYRRWQSCGSACCKKTYKICRDSSTTISHGFTGVNQEGQNRILRIIQMSTTTTVWCTEANKYLPKSCETTCWSSP
ncbi:MAG: hypothetical protein MUE72_13820 [Chitinophagaceae bacterium]|jgi:hypothetical protein|nr:hypothetical protein [Chitinophagaceae bacterium]